MVVHVDLSPITAHKVPLLRVGEVGSIDSLCGKRSVKGRLVAGTKEAVVGDHVLAEDAPEVLAQETLVQALAMFAQGAIEQVLEHLIHQSTVVLR